MFVLARKPSYCTHACLVRYLRARNWKLAPVEELLRGTMAWRQEFGVHIDPERLATGMKIPRINICLVPYIPSPICCHRTTFCTVPTIRPRGGYVVAGARLGCSPASYAWPPVDVMHHYFALLTKPAANLAETATGKVYVHGNDRFGRPVMYQRPRRENTKDYIQQVSTTRLKFIFATAKAPLASNNNDIMSVTLQWDPPPHFLIPRPLLRHLSHLSFHH